MTDWCAGLQAIGEAADLVRLGEAPCALAGASDTGVLPFAFACFAHAGFFARGFVPAEAAVVFVVEEERRALSRSRRPYGAVVGFHTASGPDAPLRASHAATSDAGWDAPDIWCVAPAFRDEGPAPAPAGMVCDTTPSTGHALAAAAPLSLACALARDDDRRALVVATSTFGPAAALAIDACRRRPRSVP